MRPILDHFLITHNLLFWVLKKKTLSFWLKKDLFKGCKEIKYLLFCKICIKKKTHTHTHTHTHPHVPECKTSPEGWKNMNRGWLLPKSFHSRYTMCILCHKPFKLNQIKALTPFNLCIKIKFPYSFSQIFATRQCSLYTEISFKTDIYRKIKRYQQN